jgi:ATP adenylyltransferase
MKHIWAPWRIKYILGNAPETCFICEACSSNADREHLVLARGEHCLVIMNRYPYNNGHLMVAPKRHVGSLAETSPGEQREIMEWTIRCMEALRAVMKPDGFNVGINEGEVAGAGLRDHVHQHIVPRWGGDTNFMPVLGEAKVVPQSLESTWDQLHEALQG